MYSRVNFKEVPTNIDWTWNFRSNRREGCEKDRFVPSMMSTCSGPHDAGHKYLSMPYFSLQGRNASCPLTVSSLAESPTNHSRNLGGPMTRFDFWCMDLTNIHASSDKSRRSFQQQKRRRICKATKSSNKTHTIGLNDISWKCWEEPPFSLKHALFLAPWDNPPMVG